jgi:hypothetical protein
MHSEPKLKGELLACFILGSSFAMLPHGLISLHLSTNKPKTKARVERKYPKKSGNQKEQ